MVPERIGLASELPPIVDGTTGEISFEIYTPVASATLLKNIALNSARKLPEMTGRKLRILASGPSAINAPLDGETMALNGALGLFFNSGRAPTYWAVCDPQRDPVLAFLDCPLPQDTTYLVASKCHPDVFERLKDHRVVVWHVSDFVDAERHPVPCGTSITTCSIPLAMRLGYPDLEIWGWDACFGEDGSDHAIPQKHAYTETLDVEIEGRVFKTTRAWALEAFDLGNKAWPIYRWLGMRIEVMGDGMVRAFLAGSRAELA